MRTTPLLFPELCVQLFDGVVAKGVDAWGPTSTIPTPSVDPFLIDDDQENDVHDAPQEKDVHDALTPQAKKIKGKKSL